MLFFYTICIYKTLLKVYYALKFMANINLLPVFHFNHFHKLCAVGFVLRNRLSFV